MFSRPVTYRYHEKEKLLYAHMHTERPKFGFCEALCLLIYHIPAFTGKEIIIQKLLKGWIYKASALSDRHRGRVMLGCFLLCWFNNQHWMSSVLIYFNFCLIKCIRELMCWIWVFKMTFTQLFLNALGKFLNIIVLFSRGKKKAHRNHDSHTEGNRHLGHWLTRSKQ